MNRLGAGLIAFLLLALLTTPLFLQPVPAKEFSWSFESPLLYQLDAKGDIEDPWGNFGHLAFFLNTPNCNLPNRLHHLIGANTSHMVYTCVFAPTSPSGSSAVIGSSHSVSESIVYAVWSNLEANRAYRYQLIWPKGLASTFVQNQLARARVEFHAFLPFKLYHNPGYSTCDPNDGVKINGQPAGSPHFISIQYSRINTTHLLARLQIVFGLGMQVSTIELAKEKNSYSPCSGWEEDFVLLRATFVNATNHPKPVLVQPGDTFVFNRYISLRPMP